MSGSCPSSLKQGIWMISFTANKVAGIPRAGGSGILGLLGRRDRHRPCPRGSVRRPFRDLAAPPASASGDGPRPPASPARLGARDRARAGLVLRLWGVKQGLPYSYNSDEATHFVPRAIGFFGHDLNPHYFLNPPAYSYLLFVVFELWFGSADAVRHIYTTDPTSVFVVARVLAAVLGTVSVVLLYLAGRRLFGREVGLLAAAILGLGFLPVFYSHLALNDVPTLAPITLSLYGIAGVLRRGRGRDYALSGLGIGLAAATKYTGGVMLFCLVFAALCDGGEDRPLRAARRLLLAGLVAVVAFVLAESICAP